MCVGCIGGYVGVEGGLEGFVVSEGCVRVIVQEVPV